MFSSALLASKLKNIYIIAVEMDLCLLIGLISLAPFELTKNLRYKNKFLRTTYLKKKIKKKVKVFNVYKDKILII